MTQFSYEKAIEHLNSQAELSNSSKKWGLDNISSAIERLKIDLSSFHIIQVVGTNGKGSTCHFIHQLLLGYGFKVGAYTKPHLCSVRERICIQEYISKENFARLYFQLLPVAEEFSLSYFEKMTLLALAYFAEEKINWAVFETGLGGRLDAVTALRAKEIVFTNISIDHIEYLGNTIQEIVKEKAYTMITCQRAFSGTQSEQVKELLKSIAKEYNKPIQFVPCVSSVELTNVGTSFLFHDAPYQIPMFGIHYAHNAGLAMEVVHTILNRTNDPRIARLVLEKSFWKGRLEFIHQKGYNKILLSCAHNEGSLEADLKTICQMSEKGILPKKLSFLFATSRYRPSDQFMGMILSQLKDFELQGTITMIQPYQYPYYLLKESSYSNQLTFIQDCTEAFSRVFEPDLGQTVLVIGSIYLCGMVLRYLKHESVDQED